MKTRNISRQLLLLAIVTGAITVLAFVSLSFLHQRSNQEVAKLSNEAVGTQNRCYRLSRMLGQVDDTICQLLRIKDPDELEQKLKELESQQGKARTLIISCGDPGKPILTNYDVWTGIGKVVVDKMLLGDSGAAWSKYIEASTPQYELINNSIESYAKKTEQLINSEIETAQIRRHKTTVLQACIIGVFLLGSMIYGWRIRRWIVSHLNQISTALETTANALVSSSTQVSGASQSVADGASEQAAAIEQTSSSLEEMGSITAQSATNAQVAKGLATHTKAAAETGFENMKQMSAAMDAIEASSVNISKIVKTIDEIAFQTNILALNAAVEAARAGEAGLGFAVVAEEVRNLAARSAQAAKETSEKIEDSIQKSRNGLQFRDKVTVNLREIVGKAREMDQLVGNIAHGSAEQKQGIEQITAAVGQMDKVTQSNAATAEQCAAAAGEQKTQAAHLNDIVNTLRQLVDSTENVGNASISEGAKAISQPKTQKSLV